ncbi:hypothetical protein CAOG_05192 [Capsaspora owczarzaki ATCC 30864]|uniref:Uncharacterized protein n=1 Tax=Capsaspora owczarzaki (strain ATCC 30864) TaxID=595528 RepID=A0A0D2X3M4_CAPO3|nr:hypothetical protein CAOG_05192 [Capsaspora owczarzaki ATCC 30864]KJE94564.1 hypothetical protein CAOG_005192 [Capsaspora owczarzaki ATCC 30864]|eukprot:XP_004346877.2 hypothetical protein CAOG_05192 [Capsaspora owczarzaki ATCC 30864]
MVQSFIVLKCYADGCATHQVQQVKKSTKWTCVVTGHEHAQGDQQAVPAAEPDDTCELYSEPHDASSYLTQARTCSSSSSSSSMVVVVAMAIRWRAKTFDDPSQSYNLSSCRARGQPASIARHQAAGSHSFGQAATDIGSQSRRTGVSTAQVMTPPASNSGSTAAAASIVTRLLQDARRDLSKLSEPAPPAQRTSKWATFMPARRNNQDADDDDEDLS